MLTPLDLTIDESILAIPKSSSSMVVVEKYSRNLMKLAEFLQEGVVNVYMTQNALYSINTKYRYSYERLNNFFGKHNKGGYSSREAMIMMKHIRERISSFEGKFRISDIRVVGSIETDPDVEIIASTKSRILELKKNVLMIAVLLDLSDNIPHAFALVCGPIHKIGVEAQILDIKSQNLKTINLPRSPDIFRGDVPILEDLSNLEILLNATTMMGVAFGEQEGRRIFDIIFGKSV